MEIRIWLPDTLAGWRYCLRHPKYFIIGRYGYAKFIRQRDIMFAAKARARKAEEEKSVLRERLIKAQKELSRLKRTEDD